MSENSSSPIKPVQMNQVSNWDFETDVAIVGFGGAGSCAAIEASDAGAEVILFEASSDSGGSTALSSAEIYMGGNGGTRVQKACGYDDSSEDMFNYLMAAAGPQADEAKIRAYVEGSVDHFNWLVSKGIEFKDTEYKQRAIMSMTDDCLLYTGSEKAWPFRELAKPCPRGHNLYIEGDNGGPLFMKIMTENVHKNGVQVEFETRALSLIVDDQGAVAGLVVRQNREEKYVRARKGVVLCAGGFIMNEAMVKRFAPFLLAGNSPIGNPGDTGSGILMGMGVGAAAINMHEGFITLPYYPPSSLTYGIFVNDLGRRYINEDCYHGRVGYFSVAQESKRIFLVFSAEDFQDYQTNSYLGAEVAGTGDTIEELEGELGLPAGSLVDTVQEYNRFAAEGKDPAFNKSAEWLKPITAPFAALDCTPGRGVFVPVFTLGGLDTLPSGEVLDLEGKAIAGLYAAGRTTAGIPRRGQGYSSGMSVGDATFFGRMAGKAAAAN